MKNLLVKISLIAIMVVACNTASAVYSDNQNTLALWHCDATNWAGATETTPDDNSSGRTAKDMIINQAGEATMMPGSPYGGSYLSLEGTDQAVGVNVISSLPAALKSDLAFKADRFPSAAAYNVLMFLQPMQTLLFNDGGTTYIRMLAYDDVGTGYYLQSSKALSLDTWYTVSAVRSNGYFGVTVGNDTDGYETDSMTMVDTMYNGSADVPIGYHLFAPTAESWHFVGDIDEIRIALPIPEPFTFGLIGLLGFLAIRRK